MKVDVELKYSLSDIFKEFEIEKVNDIISLKSNDRFFVGRGCEAPDEALIADRKYMQKAYDDSQKHFSICSNANVV